MKITEYENPEEFVSQERDTLVKIVRHGDDTYVRALAICALVEWGDDPSLETVKQELDAARTVMG